MMNLDKRHLLIGAAAAAAATAAAAARQPVAQDPREQMRRKHFPNVPLVTHTGKEVLFYNDLLKDKKVAINFMYTVCSNICTPVTQNIREARRLLGPLARDIHFYSISLTPLDDDPAALRAYMRLHEIEGNWTFLTGKHANIEQVRRGLGFAAKSADEDRDLSNHSGMLRLGDERMVSWSHASAVTSGKAIARMIRMELT